MSRYDDPAGVISWIEEKAAQLTGLPVSHGEVSLSNLSICSSSQGFYFPTILPHQKTLRASQDSRQVSACSAELGEG